MCQKNALETGQRPPPNGYRYLRGKGRGQAALSTLQIDRRALHFGLGVLRLDRLLSLRVIKLRLAVNVDSLATT
jgi:hypothetical protein